MLPDLQRDPVVKPAGDVGNDKKVAGPLLVNVFDPETVNEPVIVTEPVMV